MYNPYTGTYRLSQNKKNIKRRLDIPECIVDRELFLKHNLWKGREILF